MFSGAIATRLCNVARSIDWLSAEQKGFLPGVHGIQEHTMLLETAVGEAKHRKDDMAICWLDLMNAFGSLLFFFLYYYLFVNSICSFFSFLCPLTALTHQSLRVLFHPRSFLSHLFLLLLPVLLFGHSSLVVLQNDAN